MIDDHYLNRAFSLFQLEPKLLLHSREEGGSGIDRRTVQLPRTYISRWLVRIQQHDDAGRRHTRHVSPPLDVIEIIVPVDRLRSRVYLSGDSESGHRRDPPKHARSDVIPHVSFIARAKVQEFDRIRQRTRIEAP